MPDTLPYLPEDDSAVYEGRRLVLNRIGQEWECDFIIMEEEGSPIYCGFPEHDPFTNRCWDHTSGHM